MDYNDLYSVDLRTAGWQNLSGGLQGAAPKRRAFHALGRWSIYSVAAIREVHRLKAKDACVARVITLSFFIAGAQFGALNDFYSLDPRSVTWTQIGPRNGSKAVSPPARCGHGMVSSGQLLFVSGGSASCFNAGSSGEIQF